MRHNGAARSALLLAASAAAAVAIAYLAQRHLEGSPIIVAVAACGLATIAVTIAVAAWRRAADSETRLLSLARAFDQMRATSPAPSQTSDVAAIASVVEREVERLAARSKTESEAVPGDPAYPAGSYPTPDSTIPALEEHRHFGEPSAMRAGRQASALRAISDGRFEIALRPIVSLTRGTAVAFDAFAECGDGHAHFHLARPGADVSTSNHARFEALLVARALEATRRVLAGKTEAPIHVPVSRALLDEEAETTALLQRLRAHPAAARSIVFDLAAADLSASATMRDNVDAFLDVGVGLCIDLGDTPAPDFERFRKSGARQVRLPAYLLLGDTTTGTRAPSGPDIASAARDGGIDVIADRVANDDEALALVDLGIDVMSGPRFAPPRRLRDPVTANPGRAAAE